MRILFVTNNYKPYSGGVVSSIDAFVQELHAQGHEVVIATLNFLGEAHNDEPHIVRINCPIRFMYKKNYMAIPFQPTHELFLMVKAYKPDVIHVHHPFLLGESGVDVAQDLGIPCVFTYHTMYEHFSHYIPMPSVCTKPVIRWMVKRFCEKVDGIIVPSTAIKEYVRENGVVAPVEVIPSALRQSFLQVHNDSVKRQDKPFFDVLLVSRFTKEKNIPFVFEVLKLLPENVRLTLVGYGAEYEYLHDLAFNQLSLSPERIRFILKPEHHVLIDLYRSADLFLFPSKSDTQGIVLIEAFSQGLPVVAINGPGQRDIIRNGENGFIVHDEVTAAQTIQMIMGNKAMYEHLQRQAYATAQSYSPSAQIQKLLSFYEAVGSF